MKWYILQILIALDQLLNTMLCGWADETFSARCHREKRWLEYVIDLLFWWQVDKNGKWHCEQCYQHEMERRDMPEEYRKKCKHKRGG